MLFDGNDIFDIFNELSVGVLVVSGITAGFVDEKALFAFDAFTGFAVAHPVFVKLPELFNTLGDDNQGSKKSCPHGCPCELTVISRGSPKLDEAGCCTTKDDDKSQASGPFFVESESLLDRIHNDWYFYTQEFAVPGSGERIGGRFEKNSVFDEKALAAQERTEQLLVNLEESSRESGEERYQIHLESMKTTLEHDASFPKESYTDKLRRRNPLTEEEIYELEMMKKSLRTFGLATPYLYSSLFHQPEMREAFVLEKGRFYSQNTFSMARTKSTDIVDYPSIDGSDTAFAVNVYLYQLFSTISYGITDNLTASVRAGIGQVKALSDKPSDWLFVADGNLREPGESEWAIDDVDVELTYKPEVEWAKALLSLHAPFAQFSFDSTQTISLAAKVPVGSTDQYLSSGGFDATLSARTSHEFGFLPIFLDAGLHYTVTGDIDDEIFLRYAEQNNFFTLDYTLSVPISDFLGYAGFVYNTEQMGTFFENDAKIDVFHRNGGTIKLGLRYNARYKRNLLFPSVALFYNDEGNYGAQMSADASF